MKNYRKLQEALLDGETLVHVDGGEAFLDDNDNLNSHWMFPIAKNWSIKPKMAVVFGFIYYDGVLGKSFFPSEDEAAKRFESCDGQVIKLKQVVE